MTLEDLSDLDDQSIDLLNKQARIYAGWSNGTYTDEEKDQLLADFHSTPAVTIPLLTAYSDDYFKATFTVTNQFLSNEHTFRVYAYLDYVRSDTNVNGGNKFKDGDTEKKKGPFSWLPNDPYPYEDLPFQSQMDPYEGFMGSERKKILNHEGQQIDIIDDYSAECNNPLSPDHAPGDIYLVIQILWRYDTFDVWDGIFYQPNKYYGHYKWVTKIYSYDILLKNMEIYDDDTTSPEIPESSIQDPWFNPIKMPPFITDATPLFTVDVCAYDEESGLDNRITFGGVNIPNGIYLRRELIDIEIWTGREIYGYWYRYTIPNVYSLGDYNLQLKVWNDDYDGWSGDQEAATKNVEFSVIDDDTTPPWISCVYTGDYTDGNSGVIEVTAGDASGLVIDPSGTYTVPNSLGTYSWNFPAVDNDNDRPNDQLDNDEDVTIPICDDDTLPPELSDLVIIDDIHEINIDFTAVDKAGRYPATYGFECDVDGTFPNDWVEDGDYNPWGKVYVVASQEGHNKVLQFNDPGSPYHLYPYQDFSEEQTSGTVELWVYYGSHNYHTSIWIRNSAEQQLVCIRSDFNQWQYYDGTNIVNTGLSSINQWFRVSIDFSGDGTYAGLSANTYKFRIYDSNGALYYASPEAAYRDNNFGDASRFQLFTGYTQHIQFWVDAVGYSWDPNYDIGDNQYDITGDDEGIGKINIYVDDGLVSTYDSLDPSTTNFELTIDNDWPMEIGNHDVRIEVWDADDDRPGDSEVNSISGAFEISVEDMYDYVLWQLEDLKAYAEANLCVDGACIIAEKLESAQYQLEYAKYLIQRTDPSCSKFQGAFVQILNLLIECKSEILENLSEINPEDAEYIIDSLHDIRNNAIIIMVYSGYTEVVYEIALILIDIFDLHDLIEREIEQSVRNCLINLINLTVMYLEEAIFNVWDDLDVVCILTYAQSLLEQAQNEINRLLIEELILQELADELLSQINLAQDNIEAVKNLIL